MKAPERVTSRAPTPKPLPLGYGEARLTIGPGRIRASFHQSRSFRNYRRRATSPFSIAPAAVFIGPAPFAFPCGRIFLRCRRHRKHALAPGRSAIMLFAFSGVTSPAAMLGVIVGLVILGAPALRERLAGRPW